MSIVLSFAPVSGAGTIVSDYASLNAALANWLIRSDIPDDFANYFIQIAEEKIYNDIFVMNSGEGVRAIEASLTGITATSATTVPSDYLALKSMRVVSGTNHWPIQRQTSNYIYSQYPDRNQVDVPAFVAIEAGSFIFGPAPDSDYAIEGTYWKRATALSGSNTTTWMTSDIPATLLAACNAAAFQFIQNEEQAGIWVQAYQSGLQGYLFRDKAEQWSGSAPTMAAR